MLWIYFTLVTLMVFVLFPATVTLLDWRVESGNLDCMFGEQKTPKPFQKNWDKFAHTENLEETEYQRGVETRKAKKDARNNESKSSSELKKL